MFAFVVNFFLSILMLFPDDATAGEGSLLNRCGRCDYNLVGLPSDAVCPECGAAATLRQNRLRRAPKRRYRPDRLLPAILCITVGVIFMIGCAPLAETVVRYSYLVQGYSWAVACWAADTRELRYGGREGLIMPLAVAVALMPILARLRRPLAARILPWIALLIGAVITLAQWTIPYLSWVIAHQR